MRASLKRRVGPFRLQRGSAQFFQLVGSGLGFAGARVLADQFLEDEP
jgi:hypothetical protein